MLVEVGAPVCVCASDSQSGSINGIPWASNCEDWPATTIMRDHNPSCSIETYEGGMICCHHGIYHLDKNQTIPPDTFKFRMRFRFWYEDPSTVVQVPPSRRLWGDDLPYQNAFFMFPRQKLLMVSTTSPNVSRYETRERSRNCWNFQVKDAMHECKGRSDVWCSPVVLRIRHIRR